MRRRWFKGNTFCSGSCVFDIKTDTRTNKRRRLLTRGTLSLLPPVSFYLKAFSPTNFLLQLDLRVPPFSMCTSNYTQRNTFRRFSEQDLCKLSCLTFQGNKCLLMSSVALQKVFVFPPKIYCSSPELDGIPPNIWWWLRPRLSCRSHVIHYPEVGLSWANWTLYIFRRSHAYTWDPAVMTLGSHESVSSVCVPVQRPR